LDSLEAAVQVSKNIPSNAMGFRSLFLFIYQLASGPQGTLYMKLLPLSRETFFVVVIPQQTLSLGRAIAQPHRRQPFSSHFSLEHLSHDLFGCILSPSLL
jgi:hypothetical protein